jgi:hypothetical protein
MAGMTGTTTQPHETVGDADFLHHRKYVMNRLPDWRKRLEDLLTSRRQADFSWGENDGALFCADAITAMTGVDVGADLRDQYSDRAGLDALIQPLGGMEAAVTAKLGEPLAGVLLAHVGDVVMADISDGSACIGICLGPYGAFVSEKGLSKIRLLHCTRAWAVGRPPVSAPSAPASAESSDRPA